jgi:glycosyltransferase involved in cell wall biosynthesis
VDGVLYVIQQHDYSGAEILHLSLLVDDEDALVACPAGSRTEAWLREHGVATVPLRFRSLRHSGGPLETLRSLGRGVASALELRGILRDRPDRRLVYGISIRPGMLAVVAGTGLRRRVVWYVTDFVPPPPVGVLTRLLALAGCDAALATSEVVRRDFVGRSSRLGRRSTTVVPGVDRERFDARSGEPGAPRAAVLGHISPTKLTGLALDVAAIVAAEREGFTMDILGRAQFRDEDFAYERELTQRVARDPALGATVSFRGYTGDVPGALTGAGLLLHCRPDEPFGVAVIEAMAAGVPVVAPAAAGPAEIIEDGVTGLLYPPRDARAAARQVLRLLDDRELAERLAAAARTAVRERFDDRVQADRLRELIEQEAERA